MIPEEPADPVLVDTAAGLVWVGGDSLVAGALDPARSEREQVGDGRMAWSLGSELADLLWMTVPESRPALAALVGKEVADAARDDRYLLPVPYAEVANLVYLDLLGPALADLPGRQELVARCLAILRRVIIDADGDYRWEFIDDYVIRLLEDKGHGDALGAIDPGFMELVRSTRRRLGQD